MDHKKATSTTKSTDWCSHCLGNGHGRTRRARVGVAIAEAMATTVRAFGSHDVLRDVLRSLLFVSIGVSFAALLCTITITSRAR